ncbi:hypothetical protein BCF74_10461 [Knoellia remsis]|uniref:DUF6504 domain-containing protein n=1 Tax=Knoellia remsis TaxID=407159 RepID=A0A2T0UXH0_9MICO|nr:DUF6504 family protein [Knoellia remsis]PRY62625.1 hypothetical protein BCF74_10461 [Knoellia remsis]
MVRRYEERVEVRVEAASPAGVDPAGGAVAVRPRPRAFVWRGRILVVREVLDDWSERRAWWRDLGEAGDSERHERHVWRVVAGSAAGTGVYDLASDSADGCSDPWVLLLAQD